MKYYTIYKITNQINGKFYIGKHITSNLDDNYMGSGQLLKRAISKYGLDNFSKTYIEVLDSEKKMNLAEKIYVINDLEISYNLCPGGHGGFGYINENGLGHRFSLKDSVKGNKIGTNSRLASLKEKYPHGVFKNKKHSLKTRFKMSLNHKGMLNKKHSENTKILMSEQHLSSKNSQFGTCWITNSQENKKIKKEDIDNWIKLGYNKGRIK